MKTRILSGIVLVIIMASALVCRKLVFIRIKPDDCTDWNV